MTRLSRLSLLSAVAFLVSGVTLCGPLAASGVAASCGTNCLGDTLASGATLKGNQYLMTPNPANPTQGQYWLIMQTDCNLVEYVHGSGRPIWASGTGQATNDGCYATMSTTGNLEVIDPTRGQMVFQTRTSGSGVYAILQTDSNFVLYQPGGGALWATSVNQPTSINHLMTANEVLHAGWGIESYNFTYGLSMTTGGDLQEKNNRTGALIWHTGTSSPNAYAIMQGDGNLVVYSAVGTPLWNSGTWHSPGAFLDLELNGDLSIHHSLGSIFNPNVTSPIDWASNSGQTPPAVGFPSWWSGTCDSGRDTGSYQKGSWDGAAACGPDGRYFGVQFFGGAHVVHEWQCVELVMRWMWQAWGDAPYGANGDTVVSSFSGNNATKVSNSGTYHVAPQPGDVLSLENGYQYGHTVVVTGTNINSAGNGTISVLQENAGSASATYSVSNWHVGSGVTGWLHYGGLGVRFN